MNNSVKPNSANAGFWSREKNFGGREKKAPERDYTIKSKDFTSVEQGVPVPVVYGTVETAGIAITPVFGLRAVKIETESGK